MSYDIILKQVGPNRIQVIKIVRDCTSLSLSQAVVLVHQIPSAVKQGISRWEAELILTRLMRAGAKADFINRYEKSTSRTQRRQLRRCLLVRTETDA